VVIRVLTSNRAISLQTVAMDIVRVGQQLRLPAQFYDRLFPAYEIRTSGDMALLVMTVDPLFTTPWILLARDLKKGGVRNIYYGPVEGGLNRRFVYDWMREVDFVAVSNYVRDKLTEAGLRVVDVVYHGVDLKQIEHVRKSPSLSLDYFRRYGLDTSKHLVITTIANSHPRKGLAWYDKVVEEVGKKDGSIKFLVITEDKGLSYFKRRPNLVVATDFGKLPRLTVLSVIANSHVLAIPSLAEGFGLPVLEAMALGTPVVHAELPPLMEFSTGFTVHVKEIAYFDRSEAGPSGIIYEQHLWDPNEFAEVLLQAADILRNKKDVVVDWRAKSWARAKSFSIYRTYPKLLKYFFSDIPAELDDGIASYDFSAVPAAPPPAPPQQELEIAEEPKLEAIAEVSEGGADLDLDALADEILEHIVETRGPGRLTKPLYYAGGDFMLKDAIIDLLIKSGCTTLVEVFGGSGVISMYAPRDRFKSIVYNDIDNLLTNFFLVLKEKPKELARRIALMPVSRELFLRYRKLYETGEINKLDPIEKAAAAYFLLRGSMFGIRSNFAVKASMSLASIIKRQAALLPEYAKMWADVTIENKDFRDIIKTYDRPYTVFYCDPPFLSTKERDRSDYYRFTFTVNDMMVLLNTLSSIKGRFVLKLPYDHLEISFIKDWISRNSYNVKEVEHINTFVKVVGGKRPKFKTILVHNFSG